MCYILLQNLLAVPLLVCLSSHLSLAERTLEAWIYPVSEHSLNMYSLLASTARTDIPAGPSAGLARPLAVEPRSLHAMITLLSDQEAQKRDGIEDKVQELLLELQNGWTLFDTWICDL